MTIPSTHRRPTAQPGHALRVLMTMALAVLGFLPAVGWLGAAPAAAAPPVGCDGLWYVTNTSSANPIPGTYGYVDPVNGTWTQVGVLADQSSAFAIHPSAGVGYYAGWNEAGSAPNGIAYRLDLATGASTQLNTTALAMFQANRMAMSPTGQLWTMNSSGALWSSTPTTTTVGTPVNHGVIVPPAQGQGGALSGGDIAFDGSGNLWVIASDSQLWVVSADSLTSGTPTASFVGVMGTQNFPGIAFTSDGSMWGTTGGASGSLYQVDPATGHTTAMVPGAPPYVGDLASCAFPTQEMDAIKDVSPLGPVAPGATLTYRIEVVNTGPLAAPVTTLTDAVPAHTTYVADSTELNGDPVADVAGAFPFGAGALINSPGALGGVVAPNATAVVTFRVVVDAPFPSHVTEVLNQGFVTYVGGPDVPTDWPETPAPGDPTVTPVLEPGLSLVKSADRASVSVAGEVVTYTLTATNTGNTVLSDVVIEETSFTGSGAVSALACAPVQPAVLAPGDELVCSATYDVSQADMDAGAIVNVATACAEAGALCVVDEVPVSTPDRPAMGFDKRVSRVVDVNGSGLTDVGDEIWYEFELSNDGNVTLTDLVVDDALLAGVGVGVTCSPSVLAPGASVVCVADDPYVVSQADVDNGQVVNSATSVATCKPVPGGAPPRGASGACTVVTSPPDTTKTPTDSGGPNPTDSAGQTLPDTGAPAWLLTPAVGGAVLVLIGGFLLFRGRRRSEGGTD